MYLQFSSNNGGCFHPYLPLTGKSQLLPEVHGPKTKGEDLLTTLIKKFHQVNHVKKTWETG